MPRLRQTDDLADHQARLRQKLVRIQMQALRAFNGRTRKLDSPRHRSGQHAILALIKVSARPTG
jgi:hypothetical protein